MLILTIVISGLICTVIAFMFGAYFNDVGFKGLSKLCYVGGYLFAAYMTYLAFLVIGQRV